LVNRLAILRAATRGFLADGYARTSITAVAAEADVSPDLIYKQFASKRGLLVEVLNFAVTGEVDSPEVLDQHGPQAVRSERDRYRQVAMFAEDVAGRIARARPVDDVMRSAAEVDLDVAAKRAELQETRWRNMRTFISWVVANGSLRDGLDQEVAATTVWTLTSPDVHRMLVDVRGWDQQSFADWLGDTLIAELLPPLHE
jgi:AcrR family transcriptional regulator